MKMTMCTAPTMVPRTQQRRPGRPPSGKKFTMARTFPGKIRTTVRRSLDPCDNSNDSGLGFDQHMDQHGISMIGRLNWTDDRAEAKRPRIDVKLENDEINDNYGFPENLNNCKDNTSLIRTAPSSSVPSLNISNNQSSSTGKAVPRCIPLVNRNSPSSPVTLTTQLSTSSRYADITLSIVHQPEQQHRARYQTEGSRGAVKDRSGNGFPVVQLSGYNKPATLQVFIGTDMGKVTPHMFYQACRVSGKNSTPCTEKKIDGTIVIELLMDPSKEMVATCDCVGILKERNVDVEHRFPEQQGSRSKKKSTRCRMVFRATIMHDDGIQETLQVCSQPIVCTQPPGIPEICKKSLTSCPATGGLELFVLGKNFLKDTTVYFQQIDEDNHARWEQAVVPDKEFLQQTHFVCVIPPYMRPNITEPVTVRLYVVSSGKTSEAQQFVYTPVNGAIPSVRVEQPQPNPFLNKMTWPSLSKQEQDIGMMPPPGTSMVPLSQRRSSTNIVSSEATSPPLRALKQELIDESSQNSVLDATELRSTRYRHISESSLDVHPGESNMSMITDNSIDMIRHNSIAHDMIQANMNDNSNLSMVNENSVEIMGRRNSMSRSIPVCESSLDVNVSNSNMSLTDDSNCSTIHHHANALDRRIFAQAGLLTTVMPNSVHSDLSNSPADDLKVIDLRMKMPMATVADLANTRAPSLATLQSFGVTEASNSPLPTQSAQSIENYLTTIEDHKQLLRSRNILSSLTINSRNEIDLKNNSKSSHIMNSADQNSMYTQKVMNHQVIPTQTLSSNILSTTQNLSILTAAQPQQHSVSEIQPTFISSQRSLLTTNAHQSEVLNIVAKSEAAAIGEQLADQAIITTNVNTMATSMESGGLSTPITTEKLDALVNCAVETHINNNQNSANKNSIQPRTTSPQANIIMSQDVLLNSQNSLMVPSVISTTIATANLLQSGVITNAQQASPNISPEVILNSQISPSLMCRSSSGLSQESLLAATNLNNICHTSVAVENQLLQQSLNNSQQNISLLSSVTQQPPPHLSPVPQQSPHLSPVTQQSPHLSPGSHLSPEPMNTISALQSPTQLRSSLNLGVTDPEKAILLNAAVDLIETQKRISELNTKALEQKQIEQQLINNILTTRNNTNGLLQNQGLNQLPNTNGNNFMQTQFTSNSNNLSANSLIPSKSIAQDNKSEYALSGSVKNIVLQDKKNDDTMIPQSFATLTENELISMINPSCFDQV